MTTTRYFFGASQEEFPPEALLEQAVAAERAGFEGISASDHLQPWWEPGESGHTWVVARRRRPGHGARPARDRRHADRRPLPPGLIAQAWMTLDRLFPGRPFLGLGSGEALNEVPVGDEWPSPKDQIARMEQALSMIDRLWKGETITEDGPYYRPGTSGCTRSPSGGRRSGSRRSARRPPRSRAAGATGCGRCRTRSRRPR